MKKQLAGTHFFATLNYSAQHKGDKQRSCYEQLFSCYLDQLAKSTVSPETGNFFLYFMSEAYLN